MSVRGGIAASLAILAVLSAAGCQRTVSGLDTRGVPAPLPASPVSPVQSAALDPAAPAQLPSPVQPAPVDPAAVAPGTTTDTASLGNPPAPAAPAAPPASAAPVTREGVSGVWNVASDNPECRVILSFTKWSGGYRAATRRCNAPELGSVTAWDVKDNRVVLIDSGGNQIASLNSTGGERYEGATAGGSRVTFSR